MYQALLHHGPTGLKGVKIAGRAKRNLAADEVLVRLKASGLNRRDLLNMMWRNEQDAPLVLGADGAGKIEEVGSDVEEWHVGDEVILHAGVNWLTKSDAPPASFEILGSSFDGTHAQYIVVPASLLVKKPTYLTWEEAGVLSVAALTAYRAIRTKGQVKEGNTVLIPGIGSGVATFLLQMSKAMECRVIVTSRSKAKQERALQLGADVAIDTTTDWNEALQGEKVDIVFDSVGPATFQQSLHQLRPGGTCVTFGATTGDIIEFNLRSFFYSQCNILGTTLGSKEEFIEMLGFMEQHQIRPIIDHVYDLEQGVAALQRLQDSEQFGKIVLRRSKTEADHKG
ncbi:zinc-binding dehydrogenase [Brevibacillus laterosporus]|uniref:zinc-binding dehydrogenase n=1 Tax=Brevibacillus laterosporus TaxID=1465 RepID=UPI0014445FE5|nr:zinc-binding dehydrogenase [Brevibacillus laterosporus]NKQ18365.1 zinc-binding dehydrogenase [Brevibacillus laterosporus]WNX33134.1 zinc-binding dehydrogenase [Brevibacillus laterosporus]